LGREKERDRARELESTTWKSLLGFYIGREKRCLGTGRYFYRAAASGCRAWASRRLPPDVLAALLNDPEAPFRRPECRILKASSSATVGEFELVVNGVARPFIYKQFHGKRWGISLGRLFRSTPAYRSWSNAFRFEDRGLPTPRALALIHRKRVGLVRDAFLLMEKAEHTRELQEHFAALDALPGSNRLRRRRALIDAVARLLRRLHRHRFAHVDLKAPNLLVTQTDEAADPKLLFVDLVGVARKRQVSRRRRALDLARLHVSFHDEPRLSRTDKLRFLRIYLHWALRGKRGWKWWWRQIAQRTQAKVSRNRRLGRVIT
jgi:tRNA A-37 threonylcarbamoyl transferase component Bud32